MVVWIGNRQLKRCRRCGDLFAFKYHTQRYCCDPACQPVRLCRGKKRKRAEPAARDASERRRRGGLRAAVEDAKAALAELRAWMAEEHMQ
jgi:hypothetical protein